MWHVFFVSSRSCSVPSRCFGSVFFSLLGFTMSVSSGDDDSVLECAARGPGWRRSSARGGRGGLRALIWPSWLPIGMMLFVLLSCAQGKMISWL